MLTLPHIGRVCIGPLVSELQLVLLYRIWIIPSFRSGAVKLAFIRGAIYRGSVYEFTKKINQIYDLQIKSCLFHIFLEFTGDLDEPGICIYMREIGLIM